MPEPMLLPGFGGASRMVPSRDFPAPTSAMVTAEAQNTMLARGGAAGGLRPYQVEAVAAIRRELEARRSTLLVMATGLGKTQVFGAVAHAWPGRVLVLAHRFELLDQARARLAEMTGEGVGLVQAQNWSSGERLVVGSIQTLCRPANMQAFPRDAFALVVVDEAHHAVAPTYRRVLEYFDSARVLGVTATPDRQDEKAMFNVFKSVAYVREIEDGIRDKYLCPIRVTQVEVEAIDLAAVRTTAGDLNQGDLDAVMGVEEALHGVVKPTLELSGDRKTIVFTTSVANAHRMAEIFNRYRQSSARAIDGDTATDIRAATIKAFRRGDFQYLVNVGILTEGTDIPDVSCVAMARPTKSRALYAQCAGRGLRIHPGKADCLLLDFVGNSGRHRLVSALDILAGKYTDDEVAAAKQIAEETPGIDAQEALEKAREELIEKARREAEREAARRAAIKAKKVSYQTRAVDPFAAMGVRDPEEFRGGVGVAHADPEQLHKLERWYGKDVPAECTSSQAEHLIRAFRRRMAQGLCTYKQQRILGSHGYDTSRMTFDTASQLMTAIVENNYHALAPSVSAAILGGVREPGWAG